MDIYKAKMMKNIGPGGFKCPCCNSSRGKLKNSHVGKDNSLNKLARTKLKRETKEIAINVQECILDELLEYDTGFKDEK